MSRLQGKRAMVTGAARGIGAAIARRLAEEGADVAITYEHSKEKAEALVSDLQKLGRNAVAIQADSADPAAVKASVDAAAKHLGGLDILVNNAGIARGGLIYDLSLEDIDATLAVNVRSVVLATQAALAHIGEGGRIISVGSCLATRIVMPGLTIYALSKAALVGFTKALSRDLGPRGITANIVHPGPVDTDMNPATGPQAPDMLSMMAIKKYGEPEDIAGLVAYLASEEGRYINGAGIDIDGAVNA